MPSAKDESFQAYPPAMCSRPTASAPTSNPVADLPAELITSIARMEKLTSTLFATALIHGKTFHLSSASPASRLKSGCLTRAKCGVARSSTKRMEGQLFPCNWSHTVRRLSFFVLQQPHELSMRLKTTGRFLPADQPVN